MKQPALIVITMAPLLGLIVFASRGNPPPSTRSASPIPLAELQEHGVQGDLGVPLGKIVAVSGTVVENRSNAKADASEPYFLAIEAVEGRKLDKAVLFSSSAMPLARDVVGLKVGDRFQCIGYETGDFQGSPEGEFKYILPYATQGFHFAIRFVVLKVK